jgi:hypothetical protein
MLGAGGGLPHGGIFAKDTTDYTSLTGQSAFVVPYTNNAPFNDNFTVSFWFKTNDGQQNAPNGNSVQRYFCSVSGVDGSEIGSWFVFGIRPNGKIYIAHATNGDLMTVDSDDGLSNGAVDWTHIAATITGGNGSNTVVAIYINGEVSSGYTVGLDVSSANHDAFENISGVIIGALVSTGSDPKINTGQGIHDTEFIDEFALHSAALDADAITAVYNSGTPINLLADSGDYDNSSDVVLYYKFNGKFDGNALLDSHGTQNASLGEGTQFSTESAT